ncbi:hypothetical protein WJX73_000988 [Symbiochloris irregularis]|uniref:Aquaporin n=1 Tax=Symbiochloris irregularis TaxID=706552 RepID=A0AAW1PLY8_9CHLO
MAAPTSDTQSLLKTHNPFSSYLEIASEHPVMSTPDEDAAPGGLPANAKPPTFLLRARVWAALFAEFLGLAIFQIYGGSANDDVAAFGNGITLCILVYATANVSGGHLNPAVTFANCLTGHISWGRGGLYVIAQFLGAVFGALIASGMIPESDIGGGSGPGCFTHTKGTVISKSQLWWWETIMTFTLTSVVYATAVTKPGHGSLAPLAIGFSLFASAFVGGPYTGAALNPARVIGPAIVFNCYWDTAFVYIFAELFGGFLAAVAFLPLYGFGQFGSLFNTSIFSWLGMSTPKSFHPVSGVDSQPGSAHSIAPRSPYPYTPGTPMPAAPASTPVGAQFPSAFRGQPPFSSPSLGLPQRAPKPTLAALAEAERARSLHAPTRQSGGNDNLL